MPEQKIRGQFTCKVAGVTYDNKDGTNRQKILEHCEEGDELTLIHTPVPENENAVSVSRKNGEQIGYLGAGVARSIAPILDKGEQVDAEIAELNEFENEDEDTIIACRIQITEPRARVEIEKLKIAGQYIEKSSKASRGCLLVSLTSILFCYLFSV
jgi:hypothetical protein